MTPLPPFVPGSQDTRTFSVEGFTFFVYRSNDSREVAFYGQGRDGDYVPPGAPEPDVLARVLEGIAGLSPAYIGFRTDSDDVLDTVERRMLERAGHYSSIGRQVWGNLDAARGILATPRDPAWRRHVYLSGPGPSFSVDLAPGDSDDLAAYLAALDRLGPHDVRVIDTR